MVAKHVAFAPVSYLAAESMVGSMNKKRGQATFSDFLSTNRDRPLS